MSSINLKSRSKLFPILLILISALFLIAAQSPARAVTRSDVDVALSRSTQDAVDNDAREVVPQEPAKAYIEASIKADPLSGYAPLTVEFNAVFNTRINADRISVYWNFGNGDSASSPNTKYTFNEPGEYLVTLVIADGSAEYFADSVVINVHRAIRYCVADCLIAAKLQLEPDYVGDTAVISGSILVTNELGQPVDGAQVNLVWTRPDGRQVFQTVWSNREGIAHAQIQANISGLYFLEINGIELKGWTFDPVHSVLQAGIRR